MVVLGLDVSTNTVGYSFINEKEVLDMGFIDISKDDSLKEKAFHALEVLEENENSKDIDRISVEDS